MASAGSLRALPFRAVTLRRFLELLINPGQNFQGKGGAHVGAIDPRHAYSAHRSWDVPHHNGALLPRVTHTAQLAIEG